MLTDNAPFIPFLAAAAAVLTFAFVATLIPKYPARIENTAPMMKTKCSYPTNCKAKNQE